MTKRIISLFLACIMAIPIVAFPAAADELSTYVDLKGQGYIIVDGNIDTDFTFTADDSVEISFPVQFTGSAGEVEFLVECSRQLTFTHKDTSTVLTVADLGDNLWLYRGSVGTSLSEEFVISDVDSCEITIQWARYYPDFVRSNNAKYKFYMDTAGGTTASETLYTNVNVTRNATDIGAEFVAGSNGETYDVAGYFSDIYITLTYTPDQLQGYDRLSIYFSTKDWSLENVAAEYSNNPLDVSLSGFAVEAGEFVFNGTEWTYGNSQYCLEIDLTKIDFNATSNLVVYINGHMCLPSTQNEGPFLSHQFRFRVTCSQVMLLVDPVEPEVSLLVKIWQSLENMTASLLRLFEDNEEIIDDFRDEQSKDETKVDEFIDVIETTPTVNLDDVDELVKPLDELEIDTNFTTVLAGTLDGDFGTYLILFPVILAVIGYILYGKR